MTDVLALDVSLTATGWAAHRDGEWSTGTIRPKGRMGAHRLAFIDDEIRRRAKGRDVVMVEGYAFSRANQAHQLGEAGGVVRLALYQLDVPWTTANPKSVKKYATGNGNARKTAVLEAARDLLGYDGHDDNQADALWLAAMAVDYYDRLSAVPQTHRVALRKIQWPNIPTGVDRGT